MTEKTAQFFCYFASELRKVAITSRNESFRKFLCRILIEKLSSRTQNLGSEFLYRQEN